MALAVSVHDWEEAAANFQNAASRLRASDELIQAYQAEIGLSELAYRGGDIDKARKQIAPILPILPTETAEDWDEPIPAYVVCIQILQTADDPAVEELIAQGLHLLDCLAQNIADYNLRQNFLNAVRAYRTLRAQSDQHGVYRNRWGIC